MLLKLRNSHVRISSCLWFFLKCIDERDYDEGDDQGDDDGEWQDDDEDEDEDEGDDDNDDESMLLDSGLASSEPPQYPPGHIVGVVKETDCACP